MISDRHTFRRQLDKLRALAAANKPVDGPLQQLESAMERSAGRLKLRLERLPVPTYPEELPVVARREEIAAAIAANQVVIVCGETGSGKTTQLPKICLELGRGVHGLIGHTQPRRIAARTVAARIAQELKSPLGQAVGYKVRFSDTACRGHLHQADDRRHPAGGDAGRPLPERLRHDHHRRGARAQPQHRFPARLPEAAAAAAARSEAHRHLGHHRCRALLRAFRRRAR